jgi:hypothetical protein
VHVTELWLVCTMCAAGPPELLSVALLLAFGWTARAAVNGQRGRVQ